MPKAPKKTKPVETGDGAIIVTIAGTGTIPIIADGAMRRVSRGKPVEISAAEHAYLDDAGVKFTKEK